MKDDNWTGLDEPCFAYFDADPFEMTKEQYIAAYDDIAECEDGNGDIDCYHLRHGGSWYDCLSGRLSKHCNWLKKEATDG